MENTPNYNLAKPAQGKQEWHIDNNKNFDIIDDALFKKEQSSVFVATLDTNHCVHGFANFNPLRDELIAIYQCIELDEIDNYVKNSDNLSIDLVAWEITKNEKIKFRIIRNSKQQTY